MSTEQSAGRPRIFELGVDRAGCVTFIIHGFANVALDLAPEHRDYADRLLEISVDGAELAAEAHCGLTFGISEHLRQNRIGAPVAERDFDFNLTRTACIVRFDGLRKSTIQARYDFSAAFRKNVYATDGSLCAETHADSERQIHQIYFQIYARTNGAGATARLPRSTANILCTLLRAS